MQRVFIKPLGRYQVGDIRDWDSSTWSQFPNYQKITVSLDEVIQAGLDAILSDMPKRRGRPPKQQQEGLSP